MTQRKKVIILTIVVAVGVCGYLGYRMTHKNSNKRQVLTEAERVKQANERDRRALGDSKAGDADIYGALIRLAQKKEERARTEALKRMGDPSALVRAGAANALGYFSDAEAMAALDKLMKDSDSNVRIQAINGVGHGTGPEREALLNKVISSSSSGLNEVVAAWSSFLNVVSDPHKRDTGIDILAKIASDANTPVREATMASFKLLSFAPRDERVLQLLRAILKKGTNKAVMPVAIRHLSGVKDPGTAPILAKMIEHEDAQIRLAVLQGLRFSCDPKRFVMMDRVIRHDRDRVVVESAIRELQYMASKDAETVLQKIVDENILKDEEYRAARNAIVEIKRRQGSPDADPCSIAATQPKVANTTQAAHSSPLPKTKVAPVKK